MEGSSMKPSSNTAERGLCTAPPTGGPLMNLVRPCRRPPSLYLGSPESRSLQEAARLGTPRWTNVEDFLNDLPRYHCAVKPNHSFCTVCARINAEVAGDCPWKDRVDAAPPRASTVG